MLKIILNGFLGADAESKPVGNKYAINFNVAVNLDHKDAQGNKIEQTEWVKAVIWKTEHQSTKIAEYLKKGKRVLIEGIPTTKAFQSKDGDLKSVLNVNVKDLELLN